MYYLQSRYYDAKICRFINADGYVSTGQSLTGYNMFAYCNNNPVKYFDPLGESALFTLFVVATFAFSLYALIPLSIMDGLSYGDSQSDAFHKEAFGKTEAEFGFYEIEVNDITVGNHDLATKLDAAIGVSSFSKDFKGISCEASLITAEACLSLSGGGLGLYLGSYGISKNISIFNKEINIGIEVNVGLGVDFSIGPETELGLCVGVGPSISIDWDP